ncbi:MAG: AbrB family transcriptional regulator [Akkermansiaceae bacterium]|nr:AbrB family transcriptional regulator [Akkermansiaceae bacterium]
MITSTISKRGQTTLPKQIQDALHLEPGRKIIYEIHKNSVVIKLHPGVMASFGALKGLGKPTSLPLKKVRQLANEDWAEHVNQEGLKK